MKEMCECITLEIYLLHEKILKITDMILNKISISFDSLHIIVNISVIIVTLIIGYIYHQFTEKIYRKIHD